MATQTQNTQPADRPEIRPREVTYAGADGLTLFARDYGDKLSPWLPVVCLAGLTRNSRDFHELAVHLASDRQRPRRVVAFDYRGRGRSQWDPDANNYNPTAEMTDAVDGMARLGISRAVVIGTSRGGIVGMLMGVARPRTVAALVLNDIGPVIDPRGLARIKSYVGNTPLPDDWADAAHILRRLHGGQFPAMSDADWNAFARQTYRDEAGRPASDYDPALARTLQATELDQAVPTMWDEFAALKTIPVLVLRGENSDLLSAETVAAMAAGHPHLEAVTIADEGHAPHLRGAQILDRISAFVRAAEGDTPPAEAIVPLPEARFDLDSPAPSTSD